MLRSDLIDVLNDGRAWAFIGAGASADAGGPTWKQLLERVHRSVAPEVQAALSRDRGYVAAGEAGDYPRAFEILEDVVGRNVLEEAVIETLPRHPNDGHVIWRIADWPFDGYITANYDHLLEEALVQQQHPGWVSVGNAASEVRKLGGNPNQTIWHFHGSAVLDRSLSRLITSRRDYDELYLEETAQRAQLKALLGTRRLVFFGFGFQDAELLRILKQLGRLTHPAQPIHAFLPESDAGDDADRARLLADYNVDVVVYPVRDGSHAALKSLLKTYGSFILRRSLRLGRTRRSAPSYDPEATGVLVYNELVLKEPPQLASEAIETLLRARILALLNFAPGLTKQDMLDEIEAKSRAIMGGQGSLDDASRLLEAQLAALLRDDLIALDGDGYSLTAGGMALSDAQAADASRLQSQFAGGLKDRAEILEAVDPGAVGETADAFFKDCFRRRSLGLAMVINAARRPEQEFQIVALLQALPEFLQELRSPQDALVLSALVRDVLSDPTPAEKRFMGLALQAQFAVHLLSMNEDTLTARLRQLRDAAFIVDANTLIPFLARSAVGHPSASRLLSGLHELGAYLGTTELLVTEVDEHIRWSVRKVNEDGTPGLIALASVSGQAGQRSNAFVEGFVEELGSGDARSASLFSYLRDIFVLQPKATHPSERDIAKVLEKAGIEVRSIEMWDGFSDDQWAVRDELAEAIAEKRRERDTYTHERQVRAEAEALMIVRSIRAEQFSVPDRDTSYSFFISNTRVIDELGEAGLPITMRPEAALHLLATLRPVGGDEVDLFTDGLMAEMAQRHLTFVNRSRLRISFSSLIDASRSGLREELITHADLVADRYGEDAASAYADVPAEQLPLVVMGLESQRADQLATRLAEEQRLRELAQRTAKLSERERQEYEQLQAKAQQQRAAGRSKQRASASRPRGRKKRR